MASSDDALLNEIALVVSTATKTLIFVFLSFTSFITFPSVSIIRHIHVQLVRRITLEPSWNNSSNQLFCIYQAPSWVPKTLAFLQKRLLLLLLSWITFFHYSIEYSNHINIINKFYLYIPHIFSLLLLFYYLWLLFIFKLVFNKASRAHQNLTNFQKEASANSNLVAEDTQLALCVMLDRNRSIWINEKHTQEKQANGVISK